MKRARQFMTTAALALCITAPVQAATDKSAARACAEAARESLGDTHYTIIGVQRNSGFRRYSVWLNTEDRENRVYCKVRKDQVSSVVTETGSWSKRHLVRPSAPELASR